MDPEFLAGSAHVAHCPAANPTAKQWAYDAELYLVQNDTKYTSSGTVSFTLAAGASDTVDFPITMPGSEGTYNVYLDIYVAGELIAAYQATEPVVVVVVVPEKATLNGNVDLQGRPATEITVRFFDPGTDTVVLKVNTTTDSNGNFTVTGIAPSTYDVAVKGYTSLSILKANELFAGGEITTINFGILLEGDANGDDWITMADYLLFEAAFHTENPECDFNRDGFVDVGDYAIWSYNFGKHGDCAVPLLGSIGPGQIWYEGLADWKSIVSGEEIPFNKEISLAPSWINKSEINIIGHIDLSVEFPDGTVITPPAVENQDKEATPEHGWIVEFEPFISSQGGTYAITATLSSAGQVLDSVTFELVAIARAFTYSGIVCSAPPQPGKPYWWYAKFSCTVTNPSDKIVTNTIQLWLYEISTDWGPKVANNSTCEITLNPGQSVEFRYGDNWLEAHQLFNDYPGINYQMWLEDSAGGASAKCSCSP